MCRMLLKRKLHLCAFYWIQALIPNQRIANQLCLHVVGSENFILKSAFCWNSGGPQEIKIYSFCLKIATIR